MIADLYLRVPLPGAGTLASLAFRAVLHPARAIQESGGRLALVLIASGVAALVAWRWRAAERVIDPLAALVVAAGPVAALLIGALQERALAGALAVALAVILARGGVFARAGPDGEPDPSGAGRWPLAVGAVALSWIWLYQLLAAETDYRASAWAGAAFRRGLLDPPGALVVGESFVGVALLTWLPATAGRRRRAAQRGAVALAAGLATFLGLRVALDDEARLAQAVAILLLGLLAAASLAPRGGPRGLRFPGVRRVGAWLGLAGVVAGLLVAHTWATRILRCPPDDGVVRKVAELPPGFRVALDDTGERAVVAIRETHQLADVDLGPEAAPPAVVDPGPISLAVPPSIQHTYELAVLPEELLWVPPLGTWVGAGVTQADFQWPGTRSGCEDPEEFGSLLFEVDRSGRAVTRVFGVPGLCWAGAMAWDPHGRRLLLGWEYREGLSELDPVTGRSRSHPLTGPEAPSDISSLAVDPRREADRVYAGSLWGASALTELRRSDLVPLRSVSLPGVLYDLAVDAERDRVYAAGFFASRVWAVDASSLRPVGSYPTGLGTRALALDPERDLLLASSVYDGVVRVWDLAGDELLASLPVGGHVKDIAVDVAGGRALFSSQCGLLAADLDALRASGGRP